VKPHFVTRFVGAVTIALIVTALPGRADLGLDIVPAKYEMQAEAGKSETVPITVRNTSEAAVHVLVSLNDYEVGANGTLRFLDAGKGRYSLAKWAEVSPREFDIPSNSFVQVRMTVDVPATASGEYSTLVFFQTRPTRKAGGVAFSERIASKVYEVVPTSIRVGGEVEDVEAKTIAAGQQYLVGFKNTGNVHVYLNGRIEVKQNGEIVDRVTVPAHTLVERNGVCILDVTGKKLPPGSYSATAYVDYGGPNLTGGQAHFTVR